MDKKTFDKIKVKALHDFCIKNIYKDQKLTIDLDKDIKVIVEYDFYLDDGELYINESSTKLKLTGQALVFAKALGFKTSAYYDSLLEHITIRNYMKVAELEKEFARLFKEAELNDSDHMWLFEEGYEYSIDQIMEQLNDTEDELDNHIVLNGEYIAILDRKKKIVKVGCQNIPIDKVREIIAAYDKSKA